MADAKKPRNERITLPKGTAVYPKLATPDEFKGKKSYKTGVRYTVEEVQDLIELLTAKAQSYFAATKAELEAAVEEAKGEKKVAARKKLAALTLHLPFKMEVDDDGNENGNVIFNTKMNDHYKDKSGKPKYIKPALFDAKGKKITKPIDVWGGSVIKVNAEILPTYVDASGACGVVLRMRGVQIIKLVSGEADAKSMGFEEEAEEGGFEYSEADVKEPAKEDGDEDDADGAQF